MLCFKAMAMVTDLILLFSLEQSMIQILPQVVSSTSLT
jgi:hypothetical protein